MILTPQQINELHLNFQNLIVADLSDKRSDLNKISIHLIVSLLKVLYELETFADRSKQNLHS